MGWFSNDKDPDIILKEASSLVDKFKEIQTRAVKEIEEWDKRKQDAESEKDKAIEKAESDYETKTSEVDVAIRKLEQADVLASKILKLFD